MKKYLLYTIILLYIIMGSLAFAQPPPPPPMPGHDLNRIWAHEDYILAKLGITDDQKKKIEILRKNLMEDLAPLRALRYEKFTELKLLWSDPSHEKEKVLAKSKDVHDIIWQMIEKETNYRLAFKDILTQEQYSKFLESSNFGGF